MLSSDGSPVFVHADQPRLADCSAATIDPYQEIATRQQSAACEDAPFGFLVNQIR
jgi:hypothetical protein